MNRNIFFETEEEELAFEQLVAAKIEEDKLKSVRFQVLQDPSDFKLLANY